ncbi:MAG: DUF2085 domain-containing protein [Chloroflexota bacterium]|nr:DUF2085 domain-containing protein [Chloroflexota bacterium]
MNTPSSLEKSGGSVFPLSWLVVLLAVMALVMFIAATPGGLLSKADMVGYAVCHRIGSHSFTIGGRQLPLCARCTGTFIGALVGFLGQALVLRRRRASEFPPAFIIVILAGFTLLWASDGLNSYVQLIGGPHLYEPQNWLRLTTGALNGLTMSALVYPVFNFTLWRRPAPERAIRGLRDLGVLVLLEAGLVGLTLTEWSFLLYPLALLSALGVLTLLTSVTSMLVVMLVRRENVVETWREAVIPLLAGLTVAFIQIGVIDWVRYVLTGTLSGIPPLR